MNTPPVQHPQPVSPVAQILERMEKSVLAAGREAYDPDRLEHLLPLVRFWTPNKKSATEYYEGHDLSIVRGEAWIRGVLAPFVRFSFRSGPETSGPSHPSRAKAAFQLHLSTTASRQHSWPMPYLPEAGSFGVEFWIVPGTLRSPVRALGEKAEQAYSRGELLFVAGRMEPFASVLAGRAFTVRWGHPAPAWDSTPCLRLCGLTHNNSRQDRASGAPISIQLGRKQVLQPLDMIELHQVRRTGEIVSVQRGRVLVFIRKPPSAAEGVPILAVRAVREDEALFFEPGDAWGMMNVADEDVVLLRLMS